MTPNYSDFKITMKSDAFDTDALPLQAFETFILSDSILTFYPSSQVRIKDPVGVISDNIYFVEGLKFEVSIKRESDNKGLGGTYVWSGNDFIDIEPAEFISGSNEFGLVHSSIIDEYSGTKGWNKQIDKIVDELCNELNLKDITIESTNGTFLHYQMGRTQSKMIQALSELAYSKDFEKSSFVTFINNKNKFYFTPLAKLFNKKPIKELFFNMDSNLKEHSIKGAEIKTFGMLVNKRIYNPKVYKYNKDGSVSDESVEFSKQVYNNGRNAKLLIRGQELDLSEPSSIFDFGIIGSDKKEIYQGRLNSFYMMSNLLYRMECIVDYDYKIASGETVTLNVGSSNPKKLNGTEYSGTWLIINSIVIKDSEDIPFINLTLAKARVNVDKKHMYYNSFVK